MGDRSSIFKDKLAWFSSSCDNKVIAKWGEHGGSITTNPSSALFLFSSNPNCKETERLWASDCTVAIFKPTWIEDTIQSSRTRASTHGLEKYLLIPQTNEMEYDFSDDRSYKKYVTKIQQQDEERWKEFEKKYQFKNARSNKRSTRRSSKAPVTPNRNSESEGENESQSSKTNKFTQKRLNNELSNGGDRVKHSKSIRKSTRLSKKVSNVDDNSMCDSSEKIMRESPIGKSRQTDEDINQKRRSTRKSKISQNRSNEKTVKDHTKSERPPRARKMKQPEDNSHQEVVNSEEESSEKDTDITEKRNLRSKRQLTEKEAVKNKFTSGRPLRKSRYNTNSSNYAEVSNEDEDVEDASLEKGDSQKCNVMKIDNQGQPKTHSFKKSSKKTSTTNQEKKTDENHQTIDLTLEDLDNENEDFSQNKKYPKRNRVSVEKYSVSPKRKSLRKKKTDRPNYKESSSEEETDEELTEEDSQVSDSNLKNSQMKGIARQNSQTDDEESQQSISSQGKNQNGRKLRNKTEYMNSEIETKSNKEFVISACKYKTQSERSVNTNKSGQINQKRKYALRGSADESSQNSQTSGDENEIKNTRRSMRGEKNQEDNEKQKRNQEIKSSKTKIRHQNKKIKSSEHSDSDERSESDDGNTVEWKDSEKRVVIDEEERKTYPKRNRKAPQCSEYVYNGMDLTKYIEEAQSETVNMETPSTDNKKRKLFRKSSESKLPELHMEAEMITPVTQRRNSTVGDEQLSPVEIHNMLNKSPGREVLLSGNLQSSGKNYRHSIDSTLSPQVSIENISNIRKEGIIKTKSTMEEHMRTLKHKKIGESSKNAKEFTMDSFIGFTHIDELDIPNASLRDFVVNKNGCRVQLVKLAI